MLKVLHGTSNANKEPLFLREWVLNGIQVVHFMQYLGIEIMTLASCLCYRT